MIKYAAALLAGAAIATAAWWAPSALTDPDPHKVTVNLKTLPDGNCWYEVYTLHGKPTTEPICKS